jgi:hypothetical protein|tara:strand:+ start:91 stop:396 length:306 start_codon:yes stop_codon:yes gene_type:complete
MDDGMILREQVPETPNMGIAYIKLRLATLNVRIQSLVSLMNKQNEKKDSLNQILRNITTTGDNLYNIRRVQKVINSNKDVKKLFNIYRQGLNIATNEINSM